MAETMKHFGGRVAVSEDTLRMRFFKMTIFKQPRSDGAQFQDDPFSGQSFSIPGSIPVTPGSIGVRLEPIRKCIYCGETKYALDTDGPLSDEHIISRGLGGNIVLPEASCRECGNYTSAVETAVVGNLFWVPRHKLKLRAADSKRARKKFAFSCVVDGAPIELKLPLDRHPTTLFMPGLYAPGILTNRPRGQSGIHTLWSHWMNNLDLAGADEIFTPALDMVRFCQFIAKIGHAFAVAALGSDLFVPLLPDFIRRKFGRTEQFPDCYHLIGSHSKRYASGKALHELGLCFTERSRDWFLSVQIRLFANLGAPIYVAVVGRLNPGVTPEEALARQKFPKILPERTPDKSLAATQ